MPMPGELGRNHHDICLRYRGEVTIGLDGRHTNPALSPAQIALSSTRKKRLRAEPLLQPRMLMIEVQNAKESLRVSTIPYKTRRNGKKASIRRPIGRKRRQIR